MFLFFFSLRTTQNYHQIFLLHFEMNLTFSEISDNIWHLFFIVSPSICPAIYLSIYLSIYLWIRFTVPSKSLSNMSTIYNNKSWQTLPTKCKFLVSIFTMGVNRCTFSIFSITNFSAFVLFAYFSRIGSASTFSLVIFQYQSRFQIPTE